MIIEVDAVAFNNVLSELNTLRSQLSKVQAHCTEQALKIRDFKEAEKEFAKIKSLAEEAVSWAATASLMPLEHRSRELDVLLRRMQPLAEALRADEASRLSQSEQQTSS